MSEESENYWEKKYFEKKKEEETNSQISGILMLIVFVVGMFLLAVIGSKETKDHIDQEQQLEHYEQTN